ncbi:MULTISPECIES: reverse transcriptase family protein [Burkholderia cepacia complex]|uniref:reverse transcriptase family protein n=1 Tax=Burkholderia cepacia complex TaxID=87882 RepID=UPI001908E477|nr:MULTISPECIES: reverse transcriptase family protein [Burkholderia cepacia complex]MBJ9733390.1 RNA-directed DNA polymerase [Burkholderia cenocepacia]MCA8137898.1 reverse transcriptase family protein [Burkholderia cepacia]MDN7531121.1 reverse transcriptase family protein [Burkholderia orbicola]
MTQSRLSELHDIVDLARATGVPAEYIDSYANEATQADAYHVLRIPKKGRGRRGQFRVAFSAKEEWLAQLHRGIAMIVVNSVEFGEHVQGFLKKRSIKTNAAQHLGAKQILHADISNFFDAITTELVSESLVTVGVPPKMAVLIAKSCTIDGLLRQGTRCGPALANLVCRPLDADMLSLAAATGAKFTRYADDITFSGALLPTGDSVRAILNKHGFALRDDRCYIQRKGRSQYVTGLTVVDTVQPHLPKRLKARLRLVMHYVAKNGLQALFAQHHDRPIAQSESELWGMLRFANSVEPALAAKWFAQWEAGELVDAQRGPKQAA